MVHTLRLPSSPTSGAITSRPCLGIEGPTRKDFELQADCLMGAFTRHADDQALLDYGDFLAALNSAIDAGDEIFLPEDFPGAHGRPEDRVKALTKGYGGGPVTGCDLPIGPIPDGPENRERPPDPGDPSRPAAPQPTATIARPTTLPTASMPTADAEALLDLLVTTPFPEELIVYSMVVPVPRLDEEIGHLRGSIGRVAIDTGGVADILYEVYAGPEEAERFLTLWQQQVKGPLSLETQVDISGPELGPRAVLLTDEDSPYAISQCAAVVGPVVVWATAVEVAKPEEINRDSINSMVFVNCEGAVAHLRSLLEATPFLGSA